MCSKTPFIGFFFSLLIFSFSIQYATSVTAPADEVSVMFSLSKSLDAGNTLGWKDPNPCNWGGVTCSNNGVTVIKISGIILTGKQLPADLGKLQNLNQLEVVDCYLGGPLPTLAGMSNLQTLFLQNNSFSSIPDDFFKGLTSLQIVSLDDNKNLSSWQIPATLRDSSSLTNFSAISANVIGTIPNFFDAFPSLEHLALSYNNLEGELPASFAVSQMNTLWLNNQEGKQLSGSITVLQNMTSLVQVWLHVNSFSGPLPDFSGQTSLVELQIRDNQFTGPVPDSLIRLTNLKTVGLKNNRLQGPLPKFPASVQNDVTLPLNRFCLPNPGVACDPRVNALLLVLKPLNYPFRLADSWQGNNPCNSWTGISCDGGGNISVINFQNMGLVGTISPNFTLFTSLKKLILAVNNITGSIPEELTGLALLNELDVQNNDLSGPIPKFKNTQLKTSGNQNLGGATGVPPPDRSAGGPSPSGSGGSNSSNGSNGKNNGVVVGSVIGVICFILLVSGVFFYCYRKKRNRAFNRVQNPNTTLIHPRISGSDPDMIKITVAGSSINGGTVSDNLSQGSNGSSNIQVVEAGNMVISIQVLRTITDNFSDENILGRGGFGTVYKGELHDGTKVAVKRMESGMINAKGLDEFKSEIAVLTKVRHRHLVSLLWYCLDGNERLLVYEYMPQGTLSQHLFGWNEEGIRPLDWMKRLIIALDVARGVEYLHTLAHQSFIHRDLKPSNILLGDDLRAKVSDFGLVRLAPDGKDGKCMSVVTRLAGTFGYLAPEYAATGRVTTKVDIFSFGVILMELITGRKAIEESLSEENMYLVTWFRRMLISKESFQKAIDASIDLTEETLASINTVAELAGHCCAREPLQRPDMGHAVNVLSSLVDVWKPTEPDSDDMYGIDLEQTLPEALEKWRAYEGTSTFLPSLDNTQSSIPTRPFGFETFTSADGR